MLTLDLLVNLTLLKGNQCPFLADLFLIFGFVDHANTGENGVEIVDDACLVLLVQCLNLLLLV